MNSGIHDAWNLAEKLVGILNNNAADSLLDLYDRQRRGVTRDFIQTQSIRNKKHMEQSGEESLHVRGSEMHRICSDENLRREFMLDQALFSSLADAARIS